MNDARVAAAHHAARAGRLPQALALIEQALAETPHERESLALKAALLSELGRPQEALAVFAQAIAADDGDAAVHANLGVALARLGRREDAVHSFGRALERDPNLLSALVNRAGQLIQLGRHAPALADLERALALNAGLAAVHRQHSLALHALGQLEAALAAIDRAIALDAADPQSHERRAALLSALGRREESRDSVGRATALDPEKADALNARALGLLKQGRYHEGWIDHEQRWLSPRFRTSATDYAAHPIRQRLDFDVQPQALAGKRVLLVDEQGFGDQIMFYSMIPDLLVAGAEVTCLCDRRLLALAQHSFPAVAFAPVAGGEIPVAADDFDHVIPLGSLGRLFRNGIGEFPGAPYLSPRPETAAAWRERLGPKATRLRIGVCWRGGLDRTNGGRRSMDLDTLRPLLQRDDCAFVSLQHGDVASALAAANADLPKPVRAFEMAQIADFDQMAGLIAALDLIVSVQTTAIHLAGALGKPCWVMVPAVAEWRYGERGERMPWYGSVTLFRQQQADDWRGVVARVGAALDRFDPP